LVFRNGAKAPGNNSSSNDNKGEPSQAETGGTETSLHSPAGSFHVLANVFPFVVAVLVDRPQANTGDSLKRLLADRAVPPIVVPRDANGQMS
jgi:hypothetical protein